MKILSFLMLVLTFVFTPTFAQVNNDVVTIDKDVKIGKLPNGLTYYLRKNAKPENKVELRLVVNTGSVLEKEEQRGVAHFLEHMAFNGTKNFPKNELTNYLQKAGVRFGADLNASTSFDETIYMLPISTTDATVVQNGFQILRDWAGNMTLDAAEIDKERGIILEEKRARQSAGMRIMEKTLPVSTNQSIYSKRIPIGLENILKTAPRKVFVDFYTTWYRPNNMAIIAIGDIDVAATEAKIKALFSDLRNPVNAPVRPDIMLMQWHKMNKAIAVSDAENTNATLQLSFGLQKTTVENTWTKYGNSLRNNLISSLFNGRLEEYSVQANSPIGFGGIGIESGFFRGYKNNLSIFALVKKSPVEAMRTMVAEVLKAKQYGFTQTEFDRVKKDLAKEYEDGLLEKDKNESANYAREYIQNFLTKEPIPGIVAEQNFVATFLKKLTLDDVNKVVKQLNLNEPAFITFSATEALKNATTEKELLTAFEAAKNQTVQAYEEKAVASEFMDKLPPAGKIVSTSVNEDLSTKILNLSNGIKVIYKKTDFKNDEILCRASQWGGTSNLTANEANLSKYLQVISMLGIGKFKSMELQKMMSGIKANVNVGASQNQLSISGSSSVVDFEKMLQILHLKLTNVNFDAEEFEGIKATFGSQIGSLLKNPSFKFSDTLNKFKFKNNPRVGGFPKGEEVEKLKLEELKSIYNKLIANLNGATFVFVGNIDEDKFGSLIEKYIGSLVTKTNEKVTLNKANLLVPIIGKNNLIVKGGKENKAEVNFGLYGDLENFVDKENMSFTLLSEILQMKTTDKLREEMGSTYSPRVSGSMSRPPTAQYNLNLVVPAAPENAEKIVAAFEGIIKDVIAGNISNDDLLKVKTQRLKSFDTQVKTNAYWSSVLEQQDLYNYDSKNISTYSKRVEDITKEDIVNVAKKYLSNSNNLKAIMLPE